MSRAVLFLGFWVIINKMMNNKYLLGIVLTLFISAVIIGLRYQKKDYPTSPDNRIQITASFYPLFFFAQQIGGEKINAVNITPAGAEPHDYELTAQDIIQIENSKLLIINGGGLEIWAENIQKNIDPQKTITLVAGKNLTSQTILENGEKIVDPHIWLNPLLANLIVDKITQSLVQIDPANKSYYELNANNLQKRLRNLDEQYKKELLNCEQRDFITAHTSFGYLAAAYNLNQVSITGLSPDSEPSPQQLAQVADFARKNNIKYIFFESLVSPKLSQTIAQEIGAQTLTLNPIEGLNKKEISQGKYYFTEMESNLSNLKIALQCKN